MRFHNKKHQAIFVCLDQEMVRACKWYFLMDIGSEIYKNWHARFRRIGKEHKSACGIPFETSEM